MNNKEQEAYDSARRAAAIDFHAAIRGLLAGHEEAMLRMSERLAKKDMAFLMALALTEKGARLDKGGIMVGKLFEAIGDVNLCATERKFLAAHAQSPIEERSDEVEPASTSAGLTQIKAKQ